MLRQLYYEWRGRGLTRLLTLGIFLGVSAILLAAGAATGADQFVPVASITGVAVTGIGFVALLVVATILAADGSNRLFNKPYAYFTMLTPARGWQIAGAKVIVSFVDYAVALFVGIGMIMAQVHVLITVPGWATASVAIRLPTASEFWMVAYAAISIAKWILLFLFARTMMHTVYSGMSARFLLGALTFFGAAIVWGWIERLMPFSGGSWSIPDVAAGITVSLAMLAALFVPTAILLEKKMNL